MLDFSNSYNDISAIVHLTSAQYAVDSGNAILQLYWHQAGARYLLRRTYQQLHILLAFNIQTTLVYLVIDTLAL